MGRFVPLVLAALAAAVLTQPGGAAYPGRNGLIVFASDRGNQHARGLFTMQPDGSGQRRLTDATPAGSDPAWSPDGETIAFTLIRGGSTAIWSMRPDGRLVRRLTPPSRRGGRPIDLDWSPDGTRLAYVSGGMLRVLTVARATERTLGRATASPSWSPDGKRLAFGRARSVWVVGADGRGARSLGAGFQPDWSPREDRIVFVHVTQNQVGRELWTMRADGADRRRVTHGEGRYVIDGEPAWSADGQLIAFVRRTDGSVDAISPDGTGLRRVAAVFGAHDPSWSPDGSAITFGLEGSGTICTARSDGSSTTTVLAAVTDDRAVWSPDGKMLAVAHAGAGPNCGPVVRDVFLYDSAGRPLRGLDLGIFDVSWSPDGAKLATQTIIETIAVVDLRTGETRDLGLPPAIHGDPGSAQPAWSPDGRRIAFVSGYDVGFVDVATGAVSWLPRYKADFVAWAPDGLRLAVSYRNAVYTVRPDGTGHVLVARNASEPAWSPDGKQIAFVRMLTRGNTEIYVADADGSHQRRLTFAPGADVAPDWQPLP